MSYRKDIRQFLQDARMQNTEDAILVHVLRGRGWPESDIYQALAEEFESGTGLAIPAYKRSGAAGDAFLYLLSFSMLATWAIGLGSLLFTLIDAYIPDPFSPSNYFYNQSAEVANSLACVIIAYPVYLVSMRFIARVIANSPEKLESGVRKWLTYIALLIAAAVLVGYLISFLTLLLRGELTIRFTAKTFSALGIAGGVFWYYLSSTGRTHEMRVSLRENLATLLTISLIVVGAVILGFVHLGGPANQRLMQADLSTVRAIQKLAQNIQSDKRESTSPPVDLSSYPSALKTNAITGRTFEYHLKGVNGYELCSIFQASSSEYKPGQNSGEWAHSKGRYCFQFSTLQTVPLPPFNY